ncbi:MAG: RagB/SusD family nutrient uptake outer membrane protein [Bacteroidales bacterium]|nr:RagB/SusD family nutrient uptake outer membrane protein [Bacteroidales bacterium]
MKRLAIILTCLAAAACGRYLDVRPQGYVIPSTDAEFASVMHKHLQDIEGGGDEIIIGNMETLSKLEGCADDLDANIAVGNLKAYAGDLINNRMTEYCNYYEIIRDCNIVIGNLDGRSSRLASDVLSCAYAIKGICYYDLIRMYCDAPEEGVQQLGVPIVDRFDIQDRPARATLEESIDYTEKLLRKSIELKMSDDLFIFKEYITKCWLARTMFWAEQWDGCAKVCEDIIANGGYELSSRETYADVIQAENDRKGEVIIRTHINNASELDWYFGYIKGYINGRPISADFVKLFGDEPQKDVRYGVCVGAKRLNGKTPEMRVRLSEIVLMLAECYYHQGKADKALEQLNKLRRERIEGVTDLTEATLPAVRGGGRITADARGNALTPLMQAIMDERRKELFMEGDRWFELKRNGSPEWWIINNGLKYTTRRYMYTAPIYKGDVDLNPQMAQNEGYE